LFRFDQCSHPRIGLYDSDVQLPFPTSADSIIKWYSLFWPSAVAAGDFMNSDASKDCMTFYNGAVINAATLQGNTLKYGPGYANLPPAGEVGSVDYLIVSSVTNSGGLYTFTLQLQASVSREVVKSVSVNFTTDASSEQNAGDLAASSFIPLFQTIRNFEVNKRNSDVTVAIKDMWNKNSSDDIIVKPHKTTANAGDTVIVDITFIDCDDVPLSDRSLILTGTTVNGNVFPGPVNGNFTQNQVVTDGDGKAVVQFVPSLPGLAVLHVNFPHKKPNGRNDGFVGTAYLNIPFETETIKAVWNYSHSCTWDYDTTISDQSGSEFTNGHYRENEDSHFRFSGLVQRDYTVTDYKLFNKVLSMTASGTGSGYITTKDQMRIVTSDVDEIFWKDNKVENLSNKITIPVTDCSLQFPIEDDPYIEGSLLFDVTGDDKETINTYDITNGWQNSSLDNPTDDYSGPNFGQPQTGIESVDSLNNIYEFNHYDETSNDSWVLPQNSLVQALSHSKWVYDWDVIILPFDAPTGIKNSGNNIPKSYRLDQNYPNPFNPSTTISYSLPKSGMVTLKVFDILGREVAVLLNGYKTSGVYNIKFDASKLKSGVYFYRLTAGSFVSTRKLILLK